MRTYAEEAFVESLSFSGCPVTAGVKIAADAQGGKVSDTETEAETWESDLIWVHSCAYLYEQMLSPQPLEEQRRYARCL